jgi:hypothetical protein
VCLEHLAEPEPVRHELGRGQLAERQHRQQRRRRVGVDETRRDRDVLDPQRFEVQRRRLAVYADVRDMATRPDEFRADLERLGGADSLEDDVGALAVGDLLDALDDVFVSADDLGRAELERGVQAGFGAVDRDDASGAEQAGGLDRREPDRTCADDDHGVAGPDVAVQHADLVGRRQDVSQHQRGLVRHRIRQQVQ